MLSNSIKSKVNKLWNAFFAGGIANPLTAIEQICYLLFIRRLDALDQKGKEDAEWLKRKYVSLFKGNENCRWSYIKNLPGEEMLTHVRDKVFPFIKNLKGDNESFSRHMGDAVFIIPKASLLVEAIGIIDEIYNDIENETKEKGQTFQDTQGDIYEFLLSEISTSGKNGQFRTPRHIIQLMCELVGPKLGEQICDPACGTGGFLLGAYQHILTHHTSDKMKSKDENGFIRGLVGDKLADDRQWEVLKNKTFYGYDFDTTMVRIGLMNLILHGIDNPNIDYMDTLSKRYNEKDKYDVVMANPPFKGSIDKGDINEELSLKTTKTELLFVNRIINMLRIGGRAAVIVPDGVLFGSSNAHKGLRRMLLEECELQGVVSMPSGVFRPYAGVSTATIVFVKGGKTEKVWFYGIQADGYSLDDKRDKISDNDLPDIVEKWNVKGKQKDNDRKAKNFFVPVKEIIDRGYDLSINRYNEIEYETVNYEKPEVILENIVRIEGEVLEGLKELKKRI